MKHKKLLVTTLILFLLAGFRLYLPVLAKNQINQVLSKDPLYDGKVEDVSIHLWRCAYTLWDLKIEKVEGQKKFAFVKAGRIDIGLSWRELFNGAVVAKIDASQFKINIVRENKNIQIGEKTKPGQKKELHTWQDTLNTLVPLQIGTLKISESQIHFHELTSTPHFDVFLDQVEIDGHNLTNSKKISKSLFGTIELRARAMKSGILKAHIYLDPLSLPIDMKLELTLSKLKLVELNNFFTAYGKFDVKKGQFNLYTEIATADNKVKGYVKPIVKDLQVSDFAKDRDKGLGHAIWEKIVASAGQILKNYSENQQSAKIPFSGRLDGPKIDLWATFTSILQNMFVSPTAPKLDHTVKLSDVKKFNGQ